jgi:hypothetical protein
MALKAPSLTEFERRSHALASRRKFLARMGIAIGLWLFLTIAGLVIGIASYAYFDGMSLPDAFVTAAMILSGMGPVGELKTTARKVFAGLYAMLSGLIIIIATGFVQPRFSIASCIASTSRRRRNERQLIAARYRRRGGPCPSAHFATR